MKIKINGVITFRPASSKVGKHITLYDSPDTPCAITKKASNCGLVLVGNKEVSNKTRFSMNSDFLVLTRKNKENSF